MRTTAQTTPASHTCSTRTCVVDDGAGVVEEEGGEVEGEVPPDHPPPHVQRGGERPVQPPALEGKGGMGGVGKPAREGIKYRASTLLFAWRI
jgi:hypothetical protein